MSRQIFKEGCFSLGSMRIFTQKNSVFLIIVLSMAQILFISSSAKAQTVDLSFYLGGGIGMSDLNPEIPADSFLVAQEQGGGSYKIFAGYSLLNKANVDLSYTNLGEATFSHPLDPDQEFGALHYNILDISASYIFFKPQDKLNLYIKGGVATVFNDSSSNALDYEQESSMQLSFGVGAEWRIFPAVSIRTDYDRFSEDANLVSISLLKKFSVKPKRLVKLFSPKDGDQDGVPDDLDLCPDNPRLDVLNISGCPHNAVARLHDSNGEEVIGNASAQKTKNEQRDHPPQQFRRDTELHAAKSEINSLDLLSIDFEPGSHELTGVAMVVLDLLADIMHEYSSTSIEVQAHTDNVGNADDNLILSARRANSVRHYLIDQGIRGTRISAAGYGESSPVSSNDTATGRERNRRVSIEIIHN